jgi:hypothetical protein
MKRMAAMMLALLIMGCMGGEASGFSFRKGVTWGMSRGEVLTAEGQPRYESERENGLDVIEIDRAEQWGADCALEYLFYRDNLVMGRLEYDTRSDSVSVEKLIATLTERYGHPTELDPARLAEISLNDDAAPDRFLGWVIDEQTLLSLTERREKHSIKIVVSDIRETAGGADM